ncbi:MAG: enoyl-CoA hydratase/isomerase family protein [Planctomycetales bacterium]|nr:enoyl-CoA hydratase/isomerase family protein [Planctomycetales bacterium]
MSFVKVQVHGACGTIVINRPEKRNAISRNMLADLTQALGDLYLERRVRAVILTGAGTTFCAGMDLSEIHASQQENDSHRQWGEDSRQFLELITDLLQFPKPLIAAVAGPAVGGGAGLVLGCDLVIASPTANFGLPEPRRGIVAGIVAPLLAFRVGGGQAARLLLNSETIEAAEAHRIGVYHEIVAEDKNWARSVEVANQCARGAPEALQLTRRLLYETIAGQLETQLAAGAAASATARTTEAANEGISAFLEKREPKWK